MTSTAEVDLSKVVFNPSKSVTFIPVNKKQAVNVEVTNNCACPVAVKFKNTSPDNFRTQPSKAKLGCGEKMAFKCMFKGLDKERCKPNNRFTVVYVATSKNANTKKMWSVAHKSAATKKHKIAILFQGLNDTREVETQQGTANNEEEDDKDRQGTMRSKGVKVDEKTKPPAGKKATVVMFMRKEGESLSDETDDDGTEVTGPAGAPAGEDLQTVRPAGNFTGLVNPNQPGAAAQPGDELKTTRPAGPFATGQKNAAAGGAVSTTSTTDLRTTKPAGAFTGQTVGNVKGSPSAVDLKTTKPAGQFQGQTQANAAPPPPPPPKSDMKTTKNAGAFENQQTPNR